MPAGKPTKTGTLTGPDASGYWTATITGDLLGQATAYTGWVAPVTTPATTYSALAATPITVPATAQKVTAWIYGSFTQVNLPTYAFTAQNVGVYPNVSAIGGLLRPAPAKSVVLSGTLPAGFTTTAASARRVVVDTNKCNACHDQLGTSPNFHGGLAAYSATGGAVGSGPRNDATMCSICHNVNRNNTGWSVNASTFVHGIHGGGKRTMPYTWQGTAATATTPEHDYGKLLYPGVLNNCEQCHVAGSYDFSNSTNAAALPNLLWTTNAAGKINGKALDTVADPRTGTILTSYPSYVANGTPLVTNGTTYGANFSFTPATGVTVQATAGSLVSSPITAACASCHDSSPATAHMTNNGGTFFGARTAQGVLPTAVEQCLLCHGNGKVADIRAVHMPK